MESYKFNNVDPWDYLRHLFECILNIKDCYKETFCRVFITPNVKLKFILVDNFILSVEKKSIKLSLQKMFDYKLLFYRNNQFY
ncbi:MAG: transposase domain-containing protein [Phocaeicola sp.]|nr:transposase domain-containing protein [Phocaeicola sp.]